MEIHLRAQEGDSVALIAALDGGVTVDVCDEQGRTPLMVAAASENADAPMLRLLLDRGADANALTLPHALVQLNDDAIKTLEELGMDTSVYRVPNAGGRVDSVLSYAIQNNASAEKIRLLVGAGADARFVDASGYSVLTYAIYQSSGESADKWSSLIEMLIESGAPLDIKSRHGESPLGVASSFGNFAVVALLLERGADPAPLGWTALFYEIAAGNASDVIKLLDDGAALDQRDTRSRTPFLLAVHAGHQKIAELLLGRGSDRSAKGRCGKTALMYSISHDDVVMLKWLISTGFDIEECDDFGNFPLLEAAQTGAPKCVRALLDAGASAGRCTDNGSTAIKDASSPEIINMLVAAGEELSNINSEMRLQLLKLKPGTDKVTDEQYHRHKDRVFGRQNPERMNNALWDWMVRSRVSGYECASVHGDTRFPRDPVWCFRRFGQSITRLPDSRYVEIGGEHEDFYDPDFCIYNDLVVHDNGTFELYGYPQDVFPTTDFHSATLVWPHIYVIGNLGYQHQRRPGETPVYRVDCNSWSIERIHCRGNAPGWIHNHKARLVGNHRILIHGGQIDDGAGGELIQNASHFVLDLSDFTWTMQSIDGD